MAGKHLALRARCKGSNVDSAATHIGVKKNQIPLTLACVISHLERGTDGGEFPDAVVASRVYHQVGLIAAMGSWKQQRKNCELIRLGPGAICSQLFIPLPDHQSQAAF